MIARGTGLIPAPQQIERGSVNNTNAEVADCDRVGGPGRGRCRDLVENLRGQQHSDHMLDRGFVRAIDVQPKEKDGDNKDGKIHRQEDAASGRERTTDKDHWL